MMADGISYSVKRVWIKNFKSVMNLELDLIPGINLLVGPNGSGKTNILEAIYFLYKTLVEEAGKTPYMPHTPKYWSPEDLVYLRDPGTNICLGIEIVFRDNKADKTILDLKVMVTYSILGETITPIKYDLSFNDLTFVEVSLDRLKIKIHRQLYEEVNGDKVIKSKYTFKNDFYILEKPWGHPISPPLFLNAIAPGIRKLRIIDEKIVLEEFAPYLSGSPFMDYVIKLYKRIREPRLWRDIPVGITGVYRFLTRELLNKILLLRHPDIGALREPKPITGESRLNERATNLAPVLLTLIGRGGGWPKRISYMLSQLFPGLKFRLDTKFGRTVLVAEENGLPLSPSNIPDGAIKLLSILTAIELGPSILLIDEIENSLHARMLEYIVDELNSLRQPVIVATHSPIVVDLVGLERILIVRKEPNSGTIVERISDPVKLSNELKELGIALSDYIFYRKTYV